jgi:hypothetical protein
MLKETEQFWVDENNNKWAKNLYTKEQAEKWSETLIDCVSCINCEDCSFCRNCVDCVDCSCCDGCDGCKGCSWCNKCISCENCEHCFDCYDCVACIGCRDCENCRDCKYCRDCKNCENCISCTYCTKQPQIYKTTRIGSRKAITIFYKTEHKIKVVCGCFTGSLEEFEHAVNKTHANNKEYLNEYLKEIEKVKVLFYCKEGQK